ncbi:hypothetical protein SteCoe_21104 [Stentor coeruleus]|uniref:EF-hand domain-containing protein n=1 Tax=Stentor coeruleus TaxID=5963 RepID=A0A1R2BQH1_9CILI|nr:hypothetical protein SteCoe_21104 [Stentor coeruleus]
MSDLVDINRLQFQKIFEAHQQKGSLTYTDSLKICSSLKIFPDLLASQEIRKTFLTISNNESGVEILNFLQFESFMKILAKLAFKHCKKISDDYGLLITHIKEYSQKRYGAVLEIQMPKGRSISNSNVNQLKNTLSTPKNKVKASFFKPPSEKTLNRTLTSKKPPTKPAVPKVFNIINLISSDLNSLKSHIKTIKTSALTERKAGHTSTCSTSPSPNKANLLSRINKTFSDFQISYNKIDTSKIQIKKILQKILIKNHQTNNNSLLKRMAFRIWSLHIL